MSVSNASAVMFFFYGFSAFMLTLIMLQRMYKNPKSSSFLLVLSRIGVIILTFGTTCDNFRIFAGCFTNFNVYNSANKAVTWFCTLGHEILAAVAIATPCQFMQKAIENEKSKMYMEYIAYLAPILFGIIGISGLALSLPAELVEKTTCSDIGQPIKMLHPESDSSTALISVFAWTFAMITSGWFLCKKYKWKRIWAVFFVINICCLFGQGLLPALGPVYKCYGSNFWEQVAFATAVWADYELNVKELQSLLSSQDE